MKLKDLGNRLSQLGDYIRTLFEEPGENVQQLVVLFVVFGVAIVFLWAFLNFAFFIYRELKRTAKLPPEKRPSAAKGPKRPWLPIIAVLAGLIFSGFISANFYTSQPSFCNRCHLMAKYYRTWKKSSHKSVGCFACHQEPGARGFLIRNLEQSKYIPWFIGQFFSKTRSDPVASVADASCNRCHQKVVTGVVKNRGLRVSHKEIVSAEYQCVDCHSFVPHEKIAFLTQYSRKNKCFACHDGQKASGQCSLCHPDDIGILPEILKDYPKVDIKLEKFGIGENAVD